MLLTSAGVWEPCADPKHSEIFPMVYVGTMKLSDRVTTDVFMGPDGIAYRYEPGIKSWTRLIGPAGKGREQTVSHFL